MDEARRVLGRLERIEALRAARSGREALLGELKALLAEGEAWLLAERGTTGEEGDAGVGAATAAGAVAGNGASISTARAAEALESLRLALASGAEANRSEEVRPERAAL